MHWIISCDGVSLYQSHGSGKHYKKTTPFLNDRIMSDPMTDWWQAFSQNALRIEALFKRRDEWDLPAWMHEHLCAVHPDLMWEFGPAVRQPGHRLVITPEVRRDLRPLVRQLLALAPDLPGWEFYEYRLAEPFDVAMQTVEDRTGIDIRDVSVEARRGDFRRIDLKFISPRFDPKHAESYERSDAFQAAFIAIESLLGEETLDRWIGEVDLAAEPAAGGPDAIPLTQLHETVDGLISDIRESLPDRPWHAADLEQGWTCFELEPEEAEDYVEQSDLFVEVTVYPDMIQNALSSKPFDSIRWSRFGERFCYLKIDGLEGLAESSFEDRGDIEDAVNDLLRAEHLGCSIGGGTGRRYSYIELVLADVGCRLADVARQASGGTSPSPVVAALPRHRLRNRVARHIRRNAGAATARAGMNQRAKPSRRPDQLTAKAEPIASAAIGGRQLSDKFIHGDSFLEHLIAAGKNPCVGLSLGRGAGHADDGTVEAQ